MRILNVGKKDEYGNQRRIELRHKHLRASRTGGVSLRAQTRAAGLNLTANTNHGFRVSKTVTRNTQVAMQNGRFVLRGRYGSGPTKLNLSKSGVTVSTRNTLGSFNWIKPTRSSAKLFGVQVRGKNAVYAHVIYQILNLVGAIVQVMLVMAATLAQWFGQLLGLIWRLILGAPYGLTVLRRNYRNRQICKSLTNLNSSVTETLSAWTEDQLRAAIVLVFVAWGRGRDTKAALPWLKTAISSTHQAGVLTPCFPHFSDAAESLSQWHRHENITEEPGHTLTLLAALSQAASKRLGEDRLPELLLVIDEVMLLQGHRTKLQEAMIAVFSDFTGIRLQEEPGTELI